MKKHILTVMNILDSLFSLLFSLFLFYYNPVQYNFTGLLNQKSSRLQAILLILFWLFLLLYHLSFLLEKSLCTHIKQKLFILSVLILFTTFTPYQDSGDFLSQMHLFFGLITLIYLHFMLVYLILFNKQITCFYIASLLLSAFFVLTFSSITGISEWIFIVALTISLNRLHSYKK